jgi:hypothetical protein
MSLKDKDMRRAIANQMADEAKRAAGDLGPHVADRLFNVCVGLSGSAGDGFDGSYGGAAALSGAGSASVCSL